MVVTLRTGFEWTRGTEAGRFRILLCRMSRVCRAERDAQQVRTSGAVLAAVGAMICGILAFGRPQRGKAREDGALALRALGTLPGDAARGVVGGRRAQLCPYVLRPRMRRRIKPGIGNHPDAATDRKGAGGAAPAVPAERRPKSIGTNEKRGNAVPGRGPVLCTRCFGRGCAVSWPCGEGEVRRFVVRRARRSLFLRYLRPEVDGRTLAAGRDAVLRAAPG